MFNSLFFSLGCSLKYVIRKIFYESIIAKVTWSLAAYTKALDRGLLPHLFRFLLGLSLGTSVEDMFFYTPIMLAKRYATLDVLSEGRAIAGLGIGWSKDEYQVSNIPFKDRGKRADEFIQILKRIWTDDVVEFKGKFYNIPASKIGPKPIQKPHIPIYMGGFSPNTYSRIVNFDADG
jgi:hypothetical protein